MVKSKSKTKTISELAVICDVSIGAISRYVKSKGLKPVKTGKNNAKYYSSSDCDVIIAHYASKKQNPTKSTRPTNEDVIELLKDQIEQLQRQNEVLTQQLEIKDRQIETAHKLADQAQQLDLTTHTQQEQKQIATDKTPTSTEQQSQQHKSWWQRFF